MWVNSMVFFVIPPFFCYTSMFFVIPIFVIVILFKASITNGGITKYFENL